jgi:GNAT superfamily N-acetyltransferase
LSERSRYQRFFRVIERLRDTELDFFVNVDHDEHEAVGALAEDGSTGLGIARYIRLAPHSPAAEVAIVVADDAQGKGVGRVLTEALAERARANGVQRFVAQTGAGNRPFRRRWRSGSARRACSPSRAARSYSRPRCNVGSAVHPI